MMEAKSFGRSDQSVSRLGFGAMGLSGAFGAYDERELIRSVLHCLERGVTFIDTARAYGDSERIIGMALREWQGQRPFIASKVLPRGRGWGMPVPIEETYPPGSLWASVEKSLAELGVERIDLIQMHQYWPQWDAVDYWMEELLQLKAAGLVGQIGVSLPDHRHDLALPIVRSGAVDAVQTIVNVFDPLALDSLAPLCEERQVALIARCVLDEGGLTGFLREDTAFGERDFRRNYFDSVPRATYIERVERLRAFVPAHAGSLAELAIRFALTHPAVTTAIVSMHVPAYADENIAAAEAGPLPPEVFEELRRHYRWTRNFYERKY